MSVLAPVTLKFKNKSDQLIDLVLNPELRNVDGITYIARNGNNGNPDLWTRLTTSLRLPTKTSAVFKSRLKITMPVTEEISQPSAIVPRQGVITLDFQTFCPRFATEAQKREAYNLGCAAFADVIFGVEPAVQGRVAI